MKYIIPGGIILTEDEVGQTIQYPNGRESFVCREVLNNWSPPAEKQYSRLNSEKKAQECDATKLNY